ncbi:MAG: polymer-forming cytoskeletal protein [Alphaproteobacteria bacterium]|nr:polymer-forming cytoskeletal protein [Alphaproteobacteria bacterium]MCL2758021.1 polymer-forming cytoskeletal protein [Alphaproteobacteria bacterium]
MFAFTNSAEKISPTVVGAGTRFVGDIKTDGIVQVHGLVQGTVTGDTVIIARGGRILGRVNAKTLFLHGTMDGPATVDVANVFADADMSGTLSYITLNINNNNGLECKLVCRKNGNR